MTQEVEVVALQGEGRRRWGSLLQGVLQGDKQVSHWLFKRWEDSCLSHSMHSTKLEAPENHAAEGRDRSCDDAKLAGLGWRGNCDLRRR